MEQATKPCYSMNQTIFARDIRRLAYAVAPVF